MAKFNRSVTPRNDCSRLTAKVTTAKIYIMIQSPELGIRENCRLAPIESPVIN